MKNIRKDTKQKLLLAAAIFAISTAAIFIRFAQRSLPSITIATYRMVFASILLFPFSYQNIKTELRKADMKTFALLVVSGFFLAVHFASWIVSLDKTNVLSSVVLVTTTPIWVTLISPILFKNKISRKFWIGLIIAFIGILIVSGFISRSPTKLIRDDDFLTDPINKNIGNLLALLGALCAAGYVSVGRLVRQNISTKTYTFFVYTTAAIFLFTYTTFFTQASLSIRSNDLIWLILLAVIPQLIGHSLINRFLGYFPAHFVSVWLLGEPIGSTILAVIFLGEIPEVYELIGGIVILSGIIVAITGDIDIPKNN